MTCNGPSYSEPGWGIGGDFPLPLSKLYDPQLRDFFDYFQLKKGNLRLLSTGRAALKYYLQNIDLGKNDYFLLPSYLCPSLLQPFNQLDIPFEFYGIDKNLRINTESLASKLSPGTRGVLVIHYFGFPARSEFRDFWETVSTKVDLIEDCVQSLLTKSNETWCGRRGDYSLASFRKFFPVPDGAWLTGADLSNQKIPQKYSGAVAKRTVGMFLKHEYLESGEVEPELYKHYFKLLKEAERGFGRKIEVQKISKISKRLMDRLDFEKVREKRRQNYKYLHRGLESVDYAEPLFSDLEKGVTPIGFPILVNKTEVRDDLKNFLVERGVYTPIHWRLPEEISDKSFEESVEVSDRILTIPIDQRYGEEEMEYIREMLKNFKLKN